MKTIKDNMKTIKESVLRDIVKESIKKVIKESSRPRAFEVNMYEDLCEYLRDVEDDEQLEDNPEYQTFMKYIRSQYENLVIQAVVKPYIKGSKAEKVIMSAPVSDAMKQIGMNALVDSANLLRVPNEWEY